MGLNNVWFKICCSVGLKGAVQRFGLEAARSSVLLSAEGWLFILSLCYGSTILDFGSYVLTWIVKMALK